MNIYSKDSTQSEAGVGSVVWIRHIDDEGYISVNRDTKEVVLTSKESKVVEEEALWKIYFVSPSRMYSAFLCYF